MSVVFSFRRLPVSRMRQLVVVLMTFSGILCTMYLYTRWSTKLSNTHMLNSVVHQKSTPEAKAATSHPILNEKLPPNESPVKKGSEVGDSPDLHPKKKQLLKNASVHFQNPVQSVTINRTPTRRPQTSPKFHPDKKHLPNGDSVTKGSEVGGGLQTAPDHNPDKKHLVKDASVSLQITEQSVTINRATTRRPQTSKPTISLSDKVTTIDVNKLDTTSQQTSANAEKPPAKMGPENDPYYAHRVAELWDSASIEKLPPEDKKELEEWRSQGKFDGQRVGDYAHLTDFTVLPQSPCKQRTQLIVLVSSFCTNTDKRNMIRQSWANFSRTINVSVMFFLGRCENALEESAKTGDIVQGNYTDAYNNLTLKSLSRVRWYNEHCNNTDLVLFCDDDVMVDTKAILLYYPRIPNLTVLCARNDYMPIIRDKHGGLSKWYVPRWLLDGEYYPAYCSGFAYLFNSSTLGPLYKASLTLPYIFVDDAFISGFAIRELKMEVYNDGRFMLDHELISQCEEKSMFASHYFPGNTMVEEWNLRTKHCRY